MKQNEAHAKAGYTNTFISPEYIKNPRTYTNASFNF